MIVKVVGCICLLKVNKLWRFARYDLYEKHTIHACRSLYDSIHYLHASFDRSFASLISFHFHFFIFLRKGFQLSFIYLLYMIYDRLCYYETYIYRYTNIYIYIILSLSKKKRYNFINHTLVDIFLMKIVLSYLEILSE